MRFETRILLRVIALVGAVWLLVGLPQPADTILWSAIYDAGHAPLFGFVALCVLSLTRIVLPRIPVVKLYWFAFATATGLGAAAELAQFFGSRNADAGDLLRNGAGAAAFLILRWLMERDRSGRTAIGPGALRWLLLVFSAGLLLAVCTPVLLRVLDYRARDRSFPALCEFETNWEKTFLKPRVAALEPDLLPPEFGGEPGRVVGRWTFYPRPWPGLTLKEPFPDWTGHNSLRFEIWSKLDRPLEMALMVADRRHQSEEEDRAKVRFMIQPGLNEIRISLNEIRESPPFRPLEMNRITLLALYIRPPEESFTLWIDSIRLE